MNNVAYIFPGFNEYPDNIGYKKISKIFKQANIKPIVVNVDWKSKNKVFQDFLDDFINYYNINKKPNVNVYLLGFSAGAWIAFMASLLIKPKCTITCSLSPFFKEDMSSLKKRGIKPIGRKKFELFKNYKFKDIAKLSKSKTLFLYGEKDSNLIIKRSKIAHKLIKNSKLIFIPKAGHDIRQREYLAAIKIALNTEIKN